MSKYKLTLISAYVDGQLKSVFVPAKYETSFNASKATEKAKIDSSALNDLTRGIHHSKWKVRKISLQRR